MIATLSNKVTNNNLKELKSYLEENSPIRNYTNAIDYSYNLNINFHKYNSPKPFERLLYWSTFKSFICQDNKLGIAKITIKIVSVNIDSLTPCTHK